MSEVENNQVSKEIDDEVEDLTKLNQIQNKYTFWFRGGSAGAAKTGVINYQESIKKVCSFQTVEHFWRIYDHLKRPNEFRVTTEYHLFKEGITPTWEDPQNKLGGKWMVRLKKGIASRYWEDVVLAVIGEQFDVGPEICGAVISVRNNEDIISIWNKTADNTEAVNKIRDQLRRIWKLPSIIPIEYKRHQDSLVDKSSYRNPTMVWRAPGKNQDGSVNPNANSNNNGNTNSNNNNPNGANKPSGYVHHNKPSYNNNERGEHSGTSQTIPKAAWKPNREFDQQGASRNDGRFNSQSGWNKPAPTSGLSGKDSGDEIKSLDERKGFTKINISGWQRAKSSDDPLENGGKSPVPAKDSVSEPVTPAAPADVWSRVKGSAAVSAGADK